MLETINLSIEIGKQQIENRETKIVLIEHNGYSNNIKVKLSSKMKDKHIIRLKSVPIKNENERIFVDVHLLINIISDTSASHYVTAVSSPYHTSDPSVADNNKNIKINRISPMGKIIILLISLCALFIGYKFIAKKQETKQLYNDIIIAADDKDYLKAQEDISSFISKYSSSEYIKDVDLLQTEIEQELEKLELEKEMRELAIEAGLSVIELKNLYATCIMIGLDISNISGIEVGVYRQDGKLGTFFYAGKYSESFTVRLNNDHTIRYISCAGHKLIFKDTIMATIDDYLFTKSQKSKIKVWAKEVIEYGLKSPSTATFPDSFLLPYNNWDFRKNKNECSVSSYVDAQNVYGAMLRNRFKIEFIWHDEDDVELTDITYN